MFTIITLIQMMCCFQKKVADAYQENNVVKLQNILSSSEALTEQFPEKKNYKLNTIIVRALLSSCCSDFQISKKDIEFLTDHLFSVEEWGRYELWLFTNSVDLMTWKRWKPSLVR